MLYPFLSALMILPLTGATTATTETATKTVTQVPVKSATAKSASADKKSIQENLPPSPASAPKFEPPEESEIPDNEFGRMVRLGKEIFMNTGEAAKPHVGNSMRCVNCHLDRGRLADSAPLWGAYVLYPAYRKKTNKVDTLQERIQGCFRYSMNGTPPPADSELMSALVTYHFWMSKGAPTGVALKGRGYPELPKPGRAPSYGEGQKVYGKNCALCHGADGQGQWAGNEQVFPPLWGPKSYNWGAGMHRINTAAGFIKANMPLGAPKTLTDQEAWDVALYINSQERPQDPRYNGSVSKTAHAFHNENCAYGEANSQKSKGTGGNDLASNPAK